MADSTDTEHTPEISVVVASYDRPTELRRCLELLLLQKTSRQVEIIVVDNHPQSGITTSLKVDFPAVVWLEERLAGLSRARNRGIEAARGCVAVMTDDDVLPPEDWLEKLTTLLFDENGPAATTGNCLPWKMETEAERLFEAYGGLQHGSQPACFDKNWLTNWRLGFPPLWRIGTTANSAFRLSALRDPQVGLFEIRLGAGSPAGAWEDMYCFYRLLDAGYTIFYLSEAMLLHQHRRTMEQLKQQLCAYRRGETAFLMLVWRRHRDWRTLGQMFLWIPQWRMRLFLQEFANRIVGRRKYSLRLLWTETLAYFDGPKALRRSDD